MTNNDDFGFNRDDLFGFDDDDPDFGLDDSFTDEDFEDDLFGIDNDGGLGENFNFEDTPDIDDVDFPEAGFEDQAQGNGEGRQNIFRIVIGIIAVVVLVGIVGAVALFLTRGPSPDELQRTAIAEANATTLAQIAASETANAQQQIEQQTELAGTSAVQEETVAAGETATAETAGETQTAEVLNFTQTAGVTLTAQAQLQGTQDAINNIATSTAIAATESFALTLTGPPDIVTQPGIVGTPAPQTTPDPLTTPSVGTQQPTNTPMGGNTPVSISAVQMTATALAQLFDMTDTPAPNATVDDSIIVQPTVFVRPTSTPIPDGIGGGGTLPDTGLIDDVLLGNPLAIPLVAFGLVGLVFLSRGLRMRRRD